MNRQQNFDSMQISAHNRRGTQMFSLASKSLPWDDRNRLLDNPETTIRALLQVPGVHSVRTTIDTTWTAEPDAEPAPEESTPAAEPDCTCGHPAGDHSVHYGGIRVVCWHDERSTGGKLCSCCGYRPNGADQ